MLQTIKVFEKGAISEDMLISRILILIKEKFPYFKTAWDSTPKEEMTVENLITRLVGEEKRQQDDKKNAPVAFQANRGFKNKFKFFGKCFNCKQIGHKADKCPKRGKARKHHHHPDRSYKQGKRQKFNPCEICGRNNHLSAGCY